MKRRLWLGCLSAAFVSLSSGCASARWIGSRDAAARLSTEAVLLDVPERAQDGDADCGLACLAALLEHHGRELDEDARETFSTERVEASGVPAGELRDYLRGRGFRAALVRGQLSHELPTGLFALLRRDLPVLVQLVLPVGVGGEGSSHYVLVVGFEPEEEWMLVMDPTRGLGAIPYVTFEETWARADHLMIVAAPAAPAASGRSAGVVWTGKTRRVGRPGPLSEGSMRGDRRSP